MKLCKNKLKPHPLILLRIRYLDLKQHRKVNLALKLKKKLINQPVI